MKKWGKRLFCTMLTLNLLLSNIHPMIVFAAEDEHADLCEQHQHSSEYSPTTGAASYNFDCSICNSQDNDTVCDYTSACPSNDYNQESEKVITESQVPTEQEFSENNATFQPSAADYEAANAVAMLIAALPTLDTIQNKHISEQKEDYAQVQSAYDAYESLNECQKNLLPAQEELFQLYFDYFNALTAVEDETSVPNTCGDNVTWTLDSSAGILRISGTGDMYNYSSSLSSPWNEYKDEIKTIEIEHGITSIGNYAFYQCSQVTRVDISESVISIGNCAFSYCTSLKQIYVPSSVIRISASRASDSPFYGCSSSLVIYCGAASSHWGDYWNANSSGYGNNLVTNYGYSLTEFTWWTQISKDTPNLIIKIPDYITKIPDNALSGYNNIIRIDIPNSVTSIGKNAFKNCTGMRNIYIPYSVTDISAPRYSESPFYGCTETTIYCAADQAPDGWGEYWHYTTSVSTDNRYYGCTLDEYTFWSNLDKSVSVIEIPSYIVRIPKRAFFCCASLTEIILPDTITSIDYEAFYMCEGLESINIPDSVTRIGKDAFCGCSSLESIIVPNSVTSIGEGAFRCCTNLRNVNIPNSLETIEDSLFSKCSKLTYINIPESVTYIGQCAFAYCTGLKSLYIPKSVITIPSTLSSASPFWGCTSELTVYCGADSRPDGWGNAWTYYGYGKQIRVVWNSNGHEHTVVTDKAVAPSCTEKGLTEGKHCSACGEVLVAQEAIPATGHSHQAVVTDPTCTEQGYTTHTCTTCGDSYMDTYVDAMGHELTLVEGVEPTYFAAGNNAYYVCGRCVKIFKDMQGTQETTIETEQLPVLDSLASGTCGENLKWVLTQDGTLIISGTGSMADYANYGSGQAPWQSNRSSITAVVMEECVTSIGEYAFSLCSSLTSIAIPKSVTSIGTRAFYECTNLTSVAIPGSVTSIGTWTFEGCSKLASVTVGEGITEISGYMFYGCSSLTSVTLPDSITTIGSCAFENCSSLESFTIPAGVSSIGTQPFRGCTKLTDFRVAEENQNFTVEDGILFSKDKTALIRVLKILTGAYTIPEGVTSIASYAFEDCDGMTSITIPEWVNSIGDCVFYDCDGLTEVTLPDGMARIGDSLFYNCWALTEVTIPASVTSIGNSAFAECIRLESITVSESVESIGDSTFDNCRSLTNVYYSGTQEQWTAISIGFYNSYLTNATVHINSAIVTAPTCTEQGYTTHTCSGCGNSYVDSYVDATGHAEVIDAAVAPTCTEKGLTEGKHCSVCNAILVAQSEIPATGHTEATDKAVAPSCTEKGLTEGKHCSVCNAILVVQNEVPATGHSYSEETDISCNACGHIRVIDTAQPTEAAPSVNSVYTLPEEATSEAPEQSTLLQSITEESDYNNENVEESESRASLAFTVSAIAVGIVATFMMYLLIFRVQKKH